MIIEERDVGQRLDQLAAQCVSCTRSAAQKFLQIGAITVNGEVKPKNYRLRLGDEIETDLPEPIPDEALPEKIPLNIVYEDDSFLIVNKPKGMVVHPAPGHPGGTLVNALLYHCGSSLSGINGVIRPASSRGRP